MPSTSGAATTPAGTVQHQKAVQSPLTLIMTIKSPADYQQLKRLAWQLKDTKELTPREALDLYERNWRHVDTAAMDEGERELIEVLLAAFGRERLLV